MLVCSACALCGRPGRSVCPDCSVGLTPAPSLPAPLGIDACCAVFDYSAARPVITSLKNGGRRELISWLAAAMASEMDPIRGATVTWAPTGPTRQRVRGFDHAELLARAVARRRSLPCAGLLHRAPGPAQAGRSARDRRSGPSFRPARACPPVVIVVDDVLTTGGTLTAAARALRAGGAATVLAVVAARAGPSPG